MLGPSTATRNGRSRASATPISAPHSRSAGMALCFAW
jgi:hypothetical protein